MGKTNIEWVLNPDGSQGYTWNPITGCLNHDNGLCKGGGFPCYAFKLANTRLKERYLANEDYAPVDVSNVDMIDPAADPFYPRFWEERLEEPMTKITRWGRDRRVIHQQRSRGIFVCDMGDLFGMGIPEEWTGRVLEVIKDCPQHRFYLLTKQAQRLPEFSPFPENAWVGVTATNTKGMNDALYFNPDYEAKVKFISFEPLLERIDKSRLALYRYDWLIIGACTGTRLEMSELINRYGLKYNTGLTMMQYGNKWTVQPKIEWVREIVEAADKAGVKVFLKDNLEPLFLNANLYWEGFYGEQGLRQEMPE